MRGNHKEMTCFDYIYFVAKYPLVQTRYNIPTKLLYKICWHWDSRMIGNERKKCQWLHGSSVNNLHVALHHDTVVAFMQSVIYFLNIFRVNQTKLYKTKLAN